MYRLWSPQTVRAMLGQGLFIARTPSTSLPKTSLPEIGSIIAGSIPKNGSEALPGLVGVTPPNGVITWLPVSVCQYVCEKMSDYLSNIKWFEVGKIFTSTIWASFFPTTSKYHFQTSAAIGSPTEPSTRRCLIACLQWESPARLSSLKAVGAT